MFITDKTVKASQSSDTFDFTFTIKNETKSGLVVAKGPGGEVQQQIGLKVSPPLMSPRFTKTPDDARVNVGEDLRLVCSYEGNPKPKLEWRLNGKKLSLETNELLVRGAREQDAGQYEMLLTNQCGTDSAAAFVEVMPRQSAPKCRIKHYKL